MSKSKFLSGILLVVLMLIYIKMNAQENTTTGLNLNDQQKSFVLISAFTASGKTGQLKIQLNNGLDAGLTINEIKEALVQLYAYCGFPRSLNALNIFKTTLDERKAKGINDITGKPIVVENITSDKYEQGRKVLEVLTKSPQLKPAPGFGEFAPRADAFLKEHLFADIFKSDVLTYQQRELVTISALAAMPGLEPQLQAHINMGKNTGITDAQLIEVSALIEKNISKTLANLIRKIIGQPLKPEIETDMLVRISEIEIVPEYLDQYKVILQKEAAASVTTEPGVIAIFPIWQQENPTQFRIVELYANKDAYYSHTHSPQFLQYKTNTGKMVKSLKLVDMSVLDADMMKVIFKKL